MKYIVDIHGEVEGDYEIIGKFEERPRGEWLFNRCDKCGAYHKSMYRNFCPNCGAQMVEEVKT